MVGFGPLGIVEPGERQQEKWNRPLLSLTAKIREILCKYPRSSYCNELLEPSIIDKGELSWTEENGRLCKRTLVHDPSAKQEDQKRPWALWSYP